MINKSLYRFDQDPQGMDMPFKEFIIEDKRREMGELEGRHVVYRFPNEYGLSVVSGEMFYTDKDHPYELCPLYRGKLCYDAIEPDHEDVYGYQSDEDLLIMLAKVQALPQGEVK